jgi:hypothetical protein
MDLLSLETSIKNQYKKRFYSCMICKKTFYSGCSLGGHISKKHNYHIGKKQNKK